MTQPAQLGKYAITGVLGRGAMGVVYKALDPVIGRAVAIKTIHKSLIGLDMSGASSSARFRNEASAAGRLSHPGIVAIYEYGEDDDVAYIAMEYVAGRTLAQILAGNPHLPEADIRTLMDQLLDALDCAHRAGVWHRDIKPANLIVTPKGQVKVTDFGIARVESSALTQVTSSIGTPGYMAPEQYTGDGLDHRVDVHAAGALLYLMLAGRPPFAGSPEVMMYKAAHEMPPPPSTLVDAGWVRAYDAIVARAMAKKANDRYAGAADFRQALARFAVSQPADQNATTVIVARPGAAASAAPVVSASARSGSGASGSQPGSGPVSGWDAATLLQVEAALASFVGPLARVLVRQAAKTCTDLESLKAAVCAHLPSHIERGRFMARLGNGTGSRPGNGSRPGTGPRSHAQVATQGASPASHAKPLSPDVVAAARQVMARYLGPIANVVIRRSAASAASDEQFYELLADQAAGADREQVLAELRRGS